MSSRLTEQAVANYPVFQWQHYLYISPCHTLRDRKGLCRTQITTNPYNGDCAVFPLAQYYERTLARPQHQRLTRVLLSRRRRRIRKMASFINRFKRKLRGESTTPQRADTFATESSAFPDGKDTEKHDVPLPGPEKTDHEITASGTSPTIDEEGNVTDLPDDVRELPKIVRNIVSLEDDPNAPTLTFRYFLLCFIFVPPGAILYTMGVYRTTAAVYPVLFVQIGKQLPNRFYSSAKKITASHYMGHWLADVLPKKIIRIPFTKFSFNLNPGPWHVKGMIIPFRSAITV